jgi:hypothetical protein
MALEDALAYLNRSLTDPVVGYITQEDLQLLVKQIYADRAPGPEGPIGSRGQSGIQGSPGIGGSIGPVGPQGAVGAKGNIGTTGTTGATGAQGPPGVAATLNLTASPATPVTTNGQMYVVTDPKLAWLPAGSLLGDLVVYSTNKWVNLGALGVQMIPSTTAGNRIRLDIAGRPLHLDEDHIIFQTRVDAATEHDQTNLAVADRVPFSGGTLTGHIFGPNTSSGDIATTYATKGYVDLRLPVTGGTASDLNVGTLSVTSLSVTNLVDDLLVGAATTGDHALSKGEAGELFASVSHSHPIPPLVLTTSGGTLTGPLTFGSDSTTVDLTPESRYGLVLLPYEKDPAGKRIAQTDHMVYYNPSKQMWVFNGPTLTATPGVEFLTPPRSASAPTAMDQVANREFVEKMDLLAISEMKQYLADQIDALEQALTERVMVQVRAEIHK